MAEAGFALQRILVTNDDGINAPGLKVLERVAKSLCDEVWVVAPETEQSGAGHSLTLTQPLRLRDLGRRRYALSGSPTDCVLFAVCELMRETPPDLVLSGVNQGAKQVSQSGRRLFVWQRHNRVTQHAARSVHVSPLARLDRFVAVSDPHTTGLKSARQV